MPRDLLPALIVLALVIPWLVHFARRPLRIGKPADDRQELQERIKVLERIVTDPSTRTAMQIEALKDVHPANR